MKTKITLPYDSIFGVMMRQDNEIKTVISKLKWIQSSGSTFCNMGAAILNPPQDYLGFLKGLKAV